MLYYDDYGNDRVGVITVNNQFYYSSDVSRPTNNEFQFRNI